MIARGVLFLLALHFAPGAMSAETPKDNGSTPPAKEARESASAVVSTDPIADLFPNPGDSATSQQQQLPPPKAIQPTYESWDVLRQYPRYAPLPPPSVPEQKAPEPQKDTKEKTDV